MMKATTSIRRARTLYGLLLMILALGMPALASAEACDPEDHEWVPSRYYPAGSVVFHNDNWYESREIHEGMEPGITFDWKRLHSVPDCGGENRPPDPIDPADVEEGVTQTDSNTEFCERPEQWLFAESYSVGSQVSHGGKIWEAIRDTKGDMPGIQEPPHWKLVEDHCAIQSQPAL
ncbi:MULTISPECIES: carbohydrate-binding protein [Marinobacter]|uniref:Carbohydrate-binding protein n=2 Tax=Marinobacter TaxID=2742 RepID=A0A455W8S6_MARNT|nr:MULTISPECIES: carbohydrate-binding protein [unclassified Marinobacter]MDX5329096.1 carbohydrate-binding protein [Marinobacter sp.]QFS88912.1 Carbohydrate binding domain protein [Marinobacter sp. THAF197a]QFT52697.1 Carbohydrate binding domain protein [Marinobacter sp. THAF39]BBJ06006.1 hypothetical protein YBY_38550 [Marinobacter nauticus]